MHLRRTSLPCYATALWGFVVFMPVGVMYAALALTLALMLACGGWRERWARLRASPVFWPLAAYVAWTLIVLAVRPHYPQTGDNLAHGLRISITVALAMMLTRAEAVSALRGFGAAAVIAVLLIALKNTIGLPSWEIWYSVITAGSGNKSINNAVLFALLGASAAVFGLACLDGRRRWNGAGVAFAVMALMAVLVMLALPSRTAQIGMALAIFAACAHQWRRRWRALALALAVAAAIVALGVWQTPPVQQKFELGVSEIQQAQAGVVSEGSWVVRSHMYRVTTQMMLEQPVAGWGIGAWTSLWQAHGPKLLRDYNMPHDDFLWMGSQAGIPGFVSLLAILLAGIWASWRRPDLTGRLGFVAMLVLLVASSVNSALRDAQIGLGMPWIAFVYLRLTREADNPWLGVLPGRWIPGCDNSGAFNAPAPPHPS